MQLKATGHIKDDQDLRTPNMIPLACSQVEFGHFLDKAIPVKFSLCSTAIFTPHSSFFCLKLHDSLVLWTFQVVSAIFLPVVAACFEILWVFGPS